MTLVLWIYRILFIPLLLVIGPIYLWKSRGRTGAKSVFGQRMGRMPKLPAKRPEMKRVWIQAVSVGELLAVQPVIDALLADDTVEVVLTTTTITSQQMAQDRYGKRVAFVGYFPIDFWPWASSAWESLQPDLMLLTEGEWWPEHLMQAKHRRVPVLCLNARMSDRSFGRMRCVRPLLAGVRSGLTRLLASSDEDAKRFKALGFRDEQVTVTGNIKVDIVINRITGEEALDLKKSLGFGVQDLILLGASTWAGEEAALLRVWQNVRAGSDVSLRLLVVPRHAERRAEVEATVKESGAKYTLRSRDKIAESVDVCIADTTGELQGLTQVADVVFIGRTLPRHREGQTPVEAAGLGRALVMGPEMTNFKTIAQGLVGQGAARRVGGEDELTEVVRELVADPAERASMGAAGEAWHQANRGAFERTIREIRQAMGRT